MILHEKLFSIQIFQYLRQIPPRVCTLVLFIFIVFIVFCVFCVDMECMLRCIYMYLQFNNYIVGNIFMFVSM